MLDQSVLSILTKEIPMVSIGLVEPSKLTQAIRILLIMPGGGEPYNNLQPYEVVYRWKRVA